MVAELEKLARDLAARGYDNGAQDLQRKAHELRANGLIPDTISQSESPITTKDLARRIYKLADFIDQFPNNTFKNIGRNGVDLWVNTSNRNEFDGKRYSYIETEDDAVSPALGSGAAIFTAHGHDTIRSLASQYGVDTPYILTVGTHTEEDTKNDVRELLQSGEAGELQVETNYFFNQDGLLVKISTVPMLIKSDRVIDVNYQYGVKKLHSTVNGEDLQIINTALNLFETGATSQNS